MATREIPVPDIGDFKNIPVIEIFVKPGDVVAKDAPLVTLESDKATVEVPSPQPGTIKELKVKIGDRVSQGSVIVVLDVAEGAARRRRAKAESGTPGKSARRRRRRRRAAAPPKPARHHAAHGGRRAVRPGRGAGDGRRQAPRRRPSTPRCWCWAPVPAATPPRFAPPTSARRWSSSSATRARRRLPERRLHSVEGAAARREGDHRRRGGEPPRALVRQAEDRPRRAAQVQGRGGHQADRRPRRAGQGAQGDRGRGARPVRVAAPAGGRDQGRHQDRVVRPLHHRRRLAVGAHPRLPLRRQAPHGFDRRARAGRGAEAAA